MCVERNYELEESQRSANLPFGSCSRFGKLFLKLCEADEWHEMRMDVGMVPVFEGPAVGGWDKASRSRRPAGDTGLLFDERLITWGLQ